jgi:hypothetical protein
LGIGVDWWVYRWPCCVEYAGGGPWGYQGVLLGGFVEHHAEREGQWGWVHFEGWRWLIVLDWGRVVGGGCWRFV